MAGKRLAASQGSSRRTGNRIVRVSNMASIRGGGNGSFRSGRRHGRLSVLRSALPIRLVGDHPIREQGFSSDFVAGFSSRAIGRPIRPGAWFRAMIRPSRLCLIVRGSARRLSASPECSSASFPTSRTSADPFRTPQGMCDVRGDKEFFDPPKSMQASETGGSRGNSVRISPRMDDKGYIGISTLPSGSHRTS